MINNKTKTIGLEKPVLLAVFILWVCGLCSLGISSVYLKSAVTGFNWSIGSSQAGLILLLLSLISLLISILSWTTMTFETRAEDFANQFDEELYQERLKTLQADKLASLGRMSAGVAHEINNPLAIISGKIQALSRFEFDEKIQNDFKNILKQSDRIARIVKALRESAGAVSQEAPVMIPIQQIINDSSEFVRHQLESKDIRLKVSMTDEKSLIYCKPTEISHILYNLFTNSIDAIEDLSDKWIHIDVQVEDSCLKLNFIDSGGPLSTDLAFKIMDPFFTTKDIGKGTGLGLSISRSQALSNHGTLDYDVTAPTTTFVLKLPRAKI